MEHVDVVVVGAGFGGVSAALTLAERGVDTALLEALPYAGGCACTFSRHGVRYDGGATLLSGLRPVDGVALVGDTLFPGQSTLSVALGGARVAAAVAAALGAHA